LKKSAGAMKMSFNFEMVMQIVIQAVSITAIIVTVKCNQRFFEEKLNNLEKKQDKHNSLIERMAIVEQSTKSAHHRINDNSDKIEHDSRRIDSILETIHESSTVKRFSNSASLRKD
jgi:hypothetical protein